MKNTFRFLLVFLTAFLLMMAVRTVGVTVCTIGGKGLMPTFHAGDRVLVNRWSYGLRVGGSDSHFNYGRIWRQDFRKNDIVAFNDPHTGHVLICRLAGLPGDTVAVGADTLTVPGRRDCADTDYFWMESIGRRNPLDSRQLGFVPEQNVIGRVVVVLYNHDDNRPFWTGWNPGRLLLLP